jgi:hypothetical protein
VNVCDKRQRVRGRNGNRLNQDAQDLVPQSGRSQSLGVVDRPDSGLDADPGFK